EPELDTSGAHERRRKIANVHRRHHQTDAPRARALQAVEHREEETIQSRLVAALEDDVGVVDEDDRRRVLPRRFEDAVNLLMKDGRPTHDGAVDEEELALEPMREGATDRRLASSRRTGEQHAALGLEVQL